MTICWKPLCSALKIQLQIIQALFLPSWSLFLNGKGKQHILNILIKLTTDYDKSYEGNYQACMREKKKTKNPDSFV